MKRWLHYIYNTYSSYNKTAGIIWNVACGREKGERGALKPMREETARCFSGLLFYSHHPEVYPRENGEVITGLPKILT